MATSGTRTFIVTMNDICYAALRKLGVYDANSVPQAWQLANAKLSANLIKEAWGADGPHLWTNKDGILPLVANQKSYTLSDVAIIDWMNGYFRQNNTDMPMESYTREEYKRQTVKDTTGTVNRMYVDYQLGAPVAYIWPVSVNDTGLVIGTNGTTTYVCKLDHTSAAATRPTTGADYATYWEATTLTTTANVWLPATAYYSACVYFTKVVRLQDFTSTTDNPDAPPAWYQALIYAVAADQAMEYGKTPKQQQMLQQAAGAWYAVAKNGMAEHGDLIVRPSVRGYR